MRPGTFAAALSFVLLAEVAPAAPLPTNLPYRPQPRPWGNTYLPKSNPPARRLLVVDASRCTNEERIALWCLQGLVSRQQPRFWINLTPEDQEWLDWHVQKGHVDGYEVVTDWRSLFDTFGSAVRGAVVPDPALYRSDLLAVNIAACEDLLVAPAELATRLNLPLKVDLRGRFKTYAEGLGWVWEHYRNRLSRHLCGYHCSQRLNAGAFAYLLQFRGVAFWLAGKVDGAEPGADPMAEKEVIAQILADLAPNTPILGFPSGGEGIGPGEPPGVEFASTYAKALVCNDFLRNTCVTSGVRIDHWTQPPQSKTPKLDRSKVYIALAMSDGDNQNVWRRYHRRYFEHPDFGKVPLAFGMGPPIVDLQPAIAQWYYEHAAPDTEFFADVSGIGYTKPEAYGAAYTDRAAVLDGYLDWTARYLDRMNMHTLRTVRGDDALLSRYLAKLPGLHSLFADMGCYSGYSGIGNLTYTLDGVPVFRAATTWRHGAEGFLPEVREHVGNQRPAFVNGFVHCWTFDDFAKIYALRQHADPDMVFVTPTQLAALYRAAEQSEPRR